mmetsp:Transcript_6743/g.9796  ORF Transcript_6743/g.9796 Transcript_6743/m.9796 type:complete len:618 (-) Transcript_6743:39-1892(-)
MKRIHKIGKLIRKTHPRLNAQALTTTKIGFLKDYRYKPVSTFLLKPQIHNYELRSFRYVDGHQKYTPNPNKEGSQDDNDDVDHFNWNLFLKIVGAYVGSTIIFLIFSEEFKMVLPPVFATAFHKLDAHWVWAKILWKAMRSNESNMDEFHEYTSTELEAFLRRTGGYYVEATRYLLTFKKQLLPKPYWRLEGVINEIIAKNDPVPFIELKKTFEDEIGYLNEVFSYFSESPSFVNHLVQEHYARILDVDDPVTVTIVRPDVSRTDLVTLQHLLTITEFFFRNVDMLQHLQELYDYDENTYRVIGRKKGYELLGENDERMADLKTSFPHMKFPKLYDHFKSTSVNIRDYVDDALPITDLERLEQADISPSAIASALSNFVAHEIFISGVVPFDLDASQFRVRRNKNTWNNRVELIVNDHLVKPLNLEERIAFAKLWASDFSNDWSSHHEALWRMHVPLPFHRIFYKNIIQDQEPHSENERMLLRSYLFTVLSSNTRYLLKTTRFLKRMQESYDLPSYFFCDYALYSKECLIMYDRRARINLLSGWFSYQYLYLKICLFKSFDFLRRYFYTSFSLLSSLMTSMWPKSPTLRSYHRSTPVVPAMTLPPPPNFSTVPTEQL